MLHLCDDQVRDLLPEPSRAVALMRETLLALADGAASVTPKSQVIHEPGGFANAMPAAWSERGLLGTSILWFEWDGDRVMCVNNLSRSPQPVAPGGSAPTT